MNKFEKIINNIVKEAATVKVPEFNDNKEQIAWIRKQRPKTKINGDITNLETGEIFLENGQKLTKYQIQRTIGLLTGNRYYDRKNKQTDDRDGLLSSNDLKKYYKIVDRKNGIFVIYRSDGQKFYPYDEDNIEEIIWYIIKEDNEQYEYDSSVKDFKEGTKYYKVIPKGINQKYVLDNFKDYYDVKYEKLGEWMQDSVFDEVKDVEYSADSKVPHKIIKKDKTKITNDDFKIIDIWIKDKNKYLKRDDGIKMMSYGLPSGNTVTLDPTFLR